MEVNNIIEIMAVNDELDEFLGIKENIVKCPNCMEDLYIYKKNLLYCKKCKFMYEHNKNEKIANKRLTYTENNNIIG